MTTAATDLNSPMDGEHRIQVGLINALCESIESDKPAADSDRLLDQLVDYCRVHFMSEELLMRLDSYEGFEEHVEDHAQMIETLEGMVVSRRAGDFPMIPGQARGLLGFLIRHIETKDARYARSPKF